MSLSLCVCLCLPFIISLPLSLSRSLSLSLSLPSRHFTFEDEYAQGSLVLVGSVRNDDKHSHIALPAEAPVSDLVYRTLRRATVDLGAPDKR